MKKALIVVSFGTSVPEAEICIENVEHAIRKAYPGYDFYRAFTSGMIRRKLKGAGVRIASPEEALDEALAQGYETVRVQPTHVIPGFEYDKLVQLCEARRSGFAELSVGHPLIFTEAELRETAEVLVSAWKKRIPAEDALLFMGHGTEHAANAVYQSLQAVFLENGDSFTYLATVEGTPVLADAVTMMKRDGVKRVHVVPFLLTAGDHARNDMAGDSDDSWKNLLTKEGFTPICHITGMGELEEILQLYGSRAKA